MSQGRSAASSLLLPTLRSVAFHILSVDNWQRCYWLTLKYLTGYGYDIFFLLFVLRSLPAHATLCLNVANAGPTLSVGTRVYCSPCLRRYPELRTTTAGVQKRSSRWVSVHDAMEHIHQLVSKWVTFFDWINNINDRRYLFLCVRVAQQLSSLYCRELPCVAPSCIPA